MIRNIGEIQTADIPLCELIRLATEGDGYFVRQVRFALQEKPTMIEQLDESDPNSFSGVFLRNVAQTALHNRSPVFIHSVDLKHEPNDWRYRLFVSNGLVYGVMGERGLCDMENVRPRGASWAEYIPLNLFSSEQEQHKF